ncbi:hypothetical protein ACF0H5_000657 [Mactra antiquata]
MCTDVDCKNIESMSKDYINEMNISAMTDNDSLSDNVTYPPPEGPLSDDSEIGLIFLFTLTTVFSITGNAFVILVFARGRRSRTDLRPFLINLAISDLIMAVFCMPFTFVTTMMNTWIFSKPMCPPVLFVQLLAVSGSVFTNMAIGIDRFMVVMFPLRSRLTKQRAKYVILVIWICSIALSSVQIKVARALEDPGGVVTCGEYWEDQVHRKIYTVLIFVLTYLIPLLILSITYTIVAILLWKRISPGNRDHARDMHQLRSKRKVVKMLIIVVAMFGICWLPIHLFALLYDFKPEVFGQFSHSTLTSIYIAVHWLAMSNSFANPLIYGFTNESFRADLITLFHMWFPCCVCLTRMLPRHSSGSTYETVVFRRQSFFRQSGKLNGNYKTSRFNSVDNKHYLNGRRRRQDYENIGNGKPGDGRIKMPSDKSGQRVILTMERDYITLQPVCCSSGSAVSEPSNDES